MAVCCNQCSSEDPVTHFMLLKPSNLDPSDNHVLDSMLLFSVTIFLELLPATPAVSLPSSPVSSPATQRSSFGNTQPLLTYLSTLQYRTLS
ncbi:hypothetical protein GOODEAATRI_026045 [Goodea atripinnis]|uniref:Uncharacterized protein n=1 Tax=Goodea atripinnis TaxID=208336 RepID=A0ABV0MYB6_9TELE